MHRVKRVCFVAAGSLLVAGACGTDADQLRGGAASTTAPPASAPTTPSTVAPPGAKSATSNRGAAQARAVGLSDVLAAPRAGLYSYSDTNGGGSGSQLTVTKVDPSTTDETITSAQGTERASVRYDSGGRSVSTTEYSGSGPAIRCDWKPHILDMQFPFTASASWLTSSVCDLPGGSSIERHDETRVTGADTVVVGGQSVRVWRLERVQSLVGNGPGAYRTKMVATDLVDPASGLTVATKGTVTTTVNGSDSTQSFSLLIDRLTPR